MIRSYTFEAVFSGELNWDPIIFSCLHKDHFIDREALREGHPKVKRVVGSYGRWDSASTLENIHNDDHQPVIGNVQKFILKKGNQNYTIVVGDFEVKSKVRPTDSWSFSHPLLQESQSIIKRGVVRRIGAGTVFVFVKVKEIEEDRPTEIIMSYSGEEFKLDRNFAQKIQTLYGTIPRELLSMTKVFQYQQASVRSRPLPFEDYAEEMSRGSIHDLMNHVILGVFSGVFQPTHIEKLCAALGSFINLQSEEGVRFIGIVRHLGFVQI